MCAICHAILHWILHSLYVSIQSANAKEVWMEMDVQDWGVPGRYEWAEVSCNFMVCILAVEGCGYWMVCSISCLL